MNKKLIIIIGPPGCGKGTQVKLIRKKYSCDVLEMGNTLREIADSNQENAGMIKSALLLGKLLPDKYVLKIVNDFIKKSDKKILFFDGFPRFLSQAKEMENMISKYGISNYAVIYIKISKPEIFKRLGKRGRADDNRKTILTRIKFFYERTKPLIKYFKSRNAFFEIDGQNSIDNIHRTFEKTINNIL